MKASIPVNHANIKSHWHQVLYVLLTMTVLVSECQLMSSRPCVMAECYITSTGQNGTMWKGLCSWVDLCREQEVRNRLIGWQESYTKELYDYRWQVLFFSISHITSSSLPAKEKKPKKVLSVDCKISCVQQWCSDESLSSIKGDFVFSNALLDLCGARWSDFCFSCSPISSTRMENIYIHQSKPAWRHLQLRVDTKTLKASLQKKKEVSPSFLSFYSLHFIFPLCIPWKL